MRDVAVVGFAQRQMEDFDGSPTCVEMLVPLLAECYEQTGWTRRDIGFWWSPDSTAIAYLQTDESSVPVSTNVRMVIHMSIAPSRPKYPTVPAYGPLAAGSSSAICSSGTGASPTRLLPSPLFWKAGYILVHQDVRGRMKSEGCTVPRVCG